MEREERSAIVPREDFSKFPGASSWGLAQRSEPETSLTWDHALRVLRKHLWFMVAIASGLTLAITAYVFLMRDVYQPTARIEIDPAGEGIRTLHEIEGPPLGSDPDYLETQVQILRSDTFAMRVMRSLHLETNPEFAGKQSHLDSKLPVASAESHPENEPYVQEQLDLANPTAHEASVLQSFQQALSVDTVRNSRLVEVKFASHDPLLAQQVINNLVTQFIDQNYKNRYTTTMEASEWLSAQLSDLRQKVQVSNQAVVDYQKRYGLVEVDDKDLPSAQLMTEVSHQLGDAQADRIQAEAYVRMIDLGQPESIPALRDDALYENLMTRFADSRAKLAQSRAVYGDENTNVKKLENEANELAAQIEAERTRILNRVRISFAAARAREQMLNDSREKLQAQMGDISSHLVEYRLLRSEALANAQLYNILQTRLHEAGIYAGLRSSNIRIVDLAPLLHKPTGPHRKLLIAVGTTLSCFLALVLAFFRESTDNTVRTTDDIWNWISLPSLALLPSVKENGRMGNQGGTLPAVGRLTSSIWQEQKRSFPKVFWPQSETVESEAIRGLRTVLQYSTQGSASRVFLVSSSSQGEGKTTVAINLAIVLARQGKTCLIDGDLRNPMIEKALGVSGITGLADVLSGRVSLDYALVPIAGLPGLFLLPARPISTSPSDLIDSDPMRSMLKLLREKFETIIIDSPPVIPFSDGRCLASFADAVVLVGRYGRTTRRGITRGFQLLADVQAPVIGVVLNDVDFSSVDYRDFRYSYGRGSGNGNLYESSGGVPPVNGPGGETSGRSRGAHA